MIQCKKFAPSVVHPNLSHLRTWVPYGPVLKRSDFLIETSSKSQVEFQPKDRDLQSRLRPDDSDVGKGNLFSRKTTCLGNEKS